MQEGENVQDNSRDETVMENRKRSRRAGKKALAMKKRGRIISSILVVFIGAFIGIRFYLFNAQGLVGNRLPMPFGMGMAVVLSGSMEPELSVNDLLIVREKAEYRTGDIVVYQKGNGLVVHRIIEIDGTTVTTKGDANNTADPPFSMEEVRGAVCGRIHGAGILIRELKTPAGTCITLIAAAILLEVSFRKERAEDEQQLDEIREEIRRLKEEKKKDSEK